MNTKAHTQQKKDGRPKLLSRVNMVALFLAAAGYVRRAVDLATDMRHCEDDSILSDEALTQLVSFVAKQRLQ